MKKAPDIAVATFDLVTRNADQGKANQEMQGAASKVFGLLESQRIAEKDIVAGDIKSTPWLEESSTKRPKIVGHEITRSFEVRVIDVRIVPKLVDDLLAMPSVDFSKLESAISNAKEVREEIWKMALTNARDQADKTAQEMNVKIDSVFAVSPRRFSLLSQTIFGENDETAERVVVVGSYIPTGEATSRFQLAPVEVNQSAYVIYLISTAK